MKVPATLRGYARVTRGEEQNTRLQVSALKGAGVSKVYQDKASGGRWQRLELQRLIDQLRSGDVVVAWKLDGLSRSLKDLLRILEKIESMKAGFLQSNGVRRYDNCGR